MNDWFDMTFQRYNIIISKNFANKKFKEGNHVHSLFPSTIYSLRQHFLHSLPHLYIGFRECEITPLRCTYIIMLRCFGALLGRFLISVREVDIFMRVVLVYIVMRSSCSYHYPCFSNGYVGISNEIIYFFF